MEYLSPTYNAFLPLLSWVEMPNSVQGALNDPKWKDTFFFIRLSGKILEKIRALEKNHTWEVKREKQLLATHPRYSIGSCYQDIISWILSYVFT